MDAGDGVTDHADVRGCGRRRAAGAALALVLGLATSCAASRSHDTVTDVPTGPATSTVEGRSRALLELQVRDDGGAGCIAAVGERGVVLWQSARGFADLDTRTPIDVTTRFEAGSLTKQLTALAVLLLDADGRVSLDDPVGKHLDGLPGWGGRVTLRQVVQHTSGVPDYFPPRRGGDPRRPLSRADVDRTIRGYRTLEHPPGSSFAYSNSGYVLLAEVVEEASGQAFPDFVRGRVLEPLGLRAVISAGGPSPGLAPSYRQVAGGFEPGGWRFYAMGPVGLRTDVADLVRFSDVYRTGAVGGTALTAYDWDDAPVVGDDDAYAGAGLFRLPDGSLYNDGDFGDYRSGFLVSPDRQRSAVLLCNRRSGVVPLDLVRSLAVVWDFR